MECNECALQYPDWLECVLYHWAALSLGSKGSIITGQKKQLEVGQLVLAGETMAHYWISCSQAAYTAIAIAYLCGILIVQ